MIELNTMSPHRRSASLSHVKRPALVVAVISAVIALAFVRWPRMIDSLGGEVRRLDGVWIVPAVALAGLSMLTAALQQRRVLRARGVSLPVGSMMAITFAANAVSVTLPLAGSTAGTAYTYSQLKRRGAEIGRAHV